MQNVIADLTGVMLDLFSSGNWLKIAIVVGVGFIGALTIQSYRQAISTSIFAMISLAFIFGGLAVIRGTMPGEFSSWANQLSRGWNDIMNMTGSSLLGYFFMFLVLIIGLYTLLKILPRR